MTLTGDESQPLDLAVDGVDRYRLFVYGTLMRNLRNHHRLHRHGAQYVGDGRIDGALVDFHGAFPGFVEEYSPGPFAGERYAGQIVGELYVVTARTLEDLDRLEGQMYRKAIVAVDRGGWIQDACTYQLINGHAREPRPRVKAIDGLIDWRQASRVCVEAAPCDACPPWGE